MPERITVNDIAAARENRVRKIRELFNSGNTGTVMLFTLNIPGAIKDSPLYRRIHQTGAEEIGKSLKWHGIRFSLSGTNHLATGPESFYSLDTPDHALIKKAMTEIEDTHPLGRIFDIDVFKKPCEKISGGRPLRKCLLCGESAFACARSGNHAAEELAAEIERMAKAFYREQCVWKIAELACRALLTEAAATPKPGLVDRANRGAHSDMDFFSFINSSAALFRTFFTIAEASWDDACGRLRGNRPLLAKLKEAGIRGEKDMYEATRGANTQKGLIFSLGLLCAGAAAEAAPFGKKLSAGQICETASTIIADDVKKHFASLSETGKTENQASGETANRKLTKGEKLYLSQGMGGARAEAAGGFRTALYGLGILRENLSGGADMNLSLADTLIRVMEKAEDTNIPGRRGISALGEARKRAEQYNSAGGVFSDPGLTKLKGIDRCFIKKGLSPGGCADILALSAFLYFTETEFM